MTAATPVLREGKNIQTVFDEYVNFFSQDLNKTFQESIMIDTNSLSSGFGIQVKLWNPPWTLKSPKNSVKITSNMPLYAQWQDKKSWIKGVIYLEQNIKSALGDNVVYMLGNSFIWTHELISNFKANGYYLAFTHTGTEFTSEIAWEKINMAKPFRKPKKS